MSDSERIHEDRVIRTRSLFYSIFFSSTYIYIYIYIYIYMYIYYISTKHLFEGDWGRDKKWESIRGSGWQLENDFRCTADILALGFSLHLSKHIVSPIHVQYLSTCLLPPWLWYLQNSLAYYSLIPVLLLADSSVLFSILWVWVQEFSPFIFRGWHDFLSLYI